MGTARRSGAHQCIRLGWYRGQRVMDHKSTNGMGMNAGGWKGREEIISIFFVRAVKWIPNVGHGIIDLKM